MQGLNTRGAGNSEDHLRILPITSILINDQVTLTKEAMEDSIPNNNPGRDKLGVWD